MREFVPSAERVSEVVDERDAWVDRHGVVLTTVIVMSAMFNVVESVVVATVRAITKWPSALA